MRSEEARIKRSIVVTRKHDHALSEFEAAVNCIGERVGTTIPRF